MTPPSANDLSIINLVLQATLLVQLVMALLLGLSLASWTAIFRKWMILRQAKSQTVGFETEFWSGKDLSALYDGAQHRYAEAGPLERIFTAGMREFLKWRQSHASDSQGMVDGARRAMNAAYLREMDRLERSLPFLANVGSVSPYIGLFGTVWGIMHAFTGLANVQQATLASVAPGIAEALVATAIGLFAAIPAVVAYNRFTADADRLATRFDNFIDEFSNILQRQK
ncbi:MAG TPA: protein TolQ [Burkholderiaceae bacterium]|nr:protein TolQ [Burkholderiaceae bacterium]